MQRGPTLSGVALVSGGVAGAQCAIRVHVACAEARCCTPAHPRPRFRALHQVTVQMAPNTSFSLVVLRPAPTP